MAKTILDKAIERFVLNAVSSLGRTVGKKLSDTVSDLSNKRKKNDLKDPMLEQEKENK